MTPLPAAFDVDPPQPGAALRQVGRDRPVLQEVRAVVEDAAEPAFVDELLGQRDGRHAAVVVPDRVGTPAFSTASTISWPSAVFIDSGFSHRIILPAFGGGDRDVVVQVVRHADVDRVDVGIVSEEQLAAAVTDLDPFGGSTAVDCSLCGAGVRGRFETWHRGRAVIDGHGDHNLGLRRGLR